MISGLAQSAGRVDAYAKSLKFAFLNRINAKEKTQILYQYLSPVVCLH